MHFTTLFTGQPKLMSRMSKPRSWQTFAAVAMVSGSEPKSWAEIGCSCGLESKIALERAVGLLRLVGPQRGAHAMRAGKFGHNKTASAQIADKAPENRVGNARHGGQHGRGRDR